MFEVANVGPVMGELYYYMLMDADTMPAIHLERYKNKLVQYASILDRQLKDREYLCGEYSIADIALYPWALVLEDMADVNLARYPNLNNWADKISKRPVARTVMGVET
jgi:GST-like protein